MYTSILKFQLSVIVKTVDDGAYDHQKAFEDELIVTHILEIRDTPSIRLNQFTFISVFITDRLRNLFELEVNHFILAKILPKIKIPTSLHACTHVISYACM